MSNICDDTHARAWMSSQADLLRAPNTVVAHAYGLDHYFVFCHRSSVDVTDAGHARITDTVK